MNMFNLINLFRSAAQSRSQLTHCVSVRWKRKPKKPSWLGIAKSKMFVIPRIKEYPADEQAEIDRLKYIYDRQLKSIQLFISKQETTILEESASLAYIQSEIEGSKVLLKEWNAKSALLREERLKREFQEQEEFALKKVSELADEENKRQAKAEELIASEIEASKTYITKENLDKAIDECFESVKDYSFALDLKGNVYEGNGTEPVCQLQAIADDFEGMLAAKNPKVKEESKRFSQSTRMKNPIYQNV